MSSGRVAAGTSCRTSCTTTRVSSSRTATPSMRVSAAARRAPGGAQQRCWAHLLREAEFLASKHEAAKPVLEQLRQLYREARTLTKRRIDRVAVHDALMLRMRQLIEICGAYKELRKSNL